MSTSKTLRYDSKSPAKVRLTTTTVRAPMSVAQMVFGAVVASQILLGVAWFNGFISIRVNSGKTGFWGTPNVQRPSLYTCHPPFPPIVLTKSQLSAVAFKVASTGLDHALAKQRIASGLDSLSVALVTPNDTVFEGYYGVLRANETDPEKRTKPNLDSIYRVASISKLFAVFELLILRRRGILEWDDPVERFLKNFTFPEQSWAQHLDSYESAGPGAAQDPHTSITLRQLASHMAGIGRDYPNADIKDWPNPEVLGRNFTPTTPAEVLDSIARLPLVAPQYTYPIYTNAGFNLLGYTLVAAANQAFTYAELLHQDVFEPLNLSSSFKVTPDNAARIAVSSSWPEETDVDLGDAYHAAAGQYSSLRDLTTVMRTFLNPTRYDSLLSAYDMREWLRPLHGWLDGFHEVGAPWEIFKIPNAYGVPRRVYSKGGNLRTHHSVFMLDPSTASGVVVLMTGRYTNGATVGQQVIQAFQFAFAHETTITAQRLFAGRWLSDDRESEVITFIEAGSLYLDRLVLNGTDLFNVLEGPNYPRTRRYGLWWTGREDEFRVAIGEPGVDDRGCEPFWEALDPLYARGAPVDLVLFEGEAADRTMKVPSVDVTLRRKSIR